MQSGRSGPCGARRRQRGEAEGAGEMNDDRVAPEMRRHLARDLLDRRLRDADKHDLGIGQARFVIEGLGTESLNRALERRSAARRDSHDDMSAPLQHFGHGRSDPARADER
jgi:hypothetical protein